MPADSPAHIEIRLRELAQLFNSMDPSPFIERDLDDDAEEFIVVWARELPTDREFELVLHLATPPKPDRAAGVEAAVRHYFTNRAGMKRREFRLLLRLGWQSLMVGLLFLTACLLLGQVVGRWGRTRRPTSSRKASPSAAGWPCGGRCKSTSTIGGRSAPNCACSNGWPACGCTSTWPRRE